MNNNETAIGSGESRRMTPGRLSLIVAPAVVIVAILVRLPYLQLVPVITDEAFEVLAALSMLHGPFIWFGPFDPTTGPLVTWILALAFRLFGPGPYLARAVTLVLGVATVALTYALAGSLSRSRAFELGARQSRLPLKSVAPSDATWSRALIAGSVAGLLLAFNPVHVLVNSRVAWSNSATPLFAAGAFLALHAASRRHNGPLLVAGGLLAGLALQTHLSALVLFPGLVAWFLARRDILVWLRRPWPYLAAGAALVGYGNMIVYNIVSKGGALANVQLHTYAWEANPSLSTYAQNVWALLANAGATIGGQVPRVNDPLGWLMGGLLVVWLVAALLYSVARGETMPALVMLSTTLIMPYFNKRYEGLLSQRYTAFLLPLCFAAMGVFAADVLARISQRAKKRQSESMRDRRGAIWAAPAVLVLIAGLATYPMRNTLAHYAAETRAGRDNRVTLGLTRYLAASLPEGTALYVSSGLKDKEEGGGYRFTRAIDYYLSMMGVSHRVLDPPDLSSALLQAPGQPAWVVLTQKDYDELTARGVRLEAVAGGPELPNEAFVARNKQ